MNNPVLADTVEEDYQEGLAKGVQRTPTVFVNRTSLIEEFTLEEISKSIEAAMATVQKNK